MSPSYTDVSHVIIIESPSPKDVLENRREGGTLAKMLKMADIETSYYEVSNSKMLETAIEMIIGDAKATGVLKTSKDGPQGMPVLIIHISAHADDDGLVLTSGEEVTWKALGDFLIYIATELKRIIPTKKAAGMSICLSACRGLSAKNMATDRDLCPFLVLVGSSETVLWSDALVGFSALYHNVMVHGKPFAEAVNAMNAACGVDALFSCLNSEDCGFK